MVTNLRDSICIGEEMYPIFLGKKMSSEIDIILLFSIVFFNVFEETCQKN